MAECVSLGTPAPETLPPLLHRRKVARFTPSLTFALVDLVAAGTSADCSGRSAGAKASPRVGLAKDRSAGRLALFFPLRRVARREHLRDRIKSRLSVGLRTISPGRA